MDQFVLAAAAKGKSTLAIRPFGKLAQRRAVEAEARRMLDFAAQTLAARGELRGAAFPAAVEHVLRVLLTLRGPVD